MMRDWQETVLSDEKIAEIERSCTFPVYDMGKKKYVVNWEKFATELIIAQAKHTGELADAVIAWMCYFATREERERITDALRGKWEMLATDGKSRHYAIIAMEVIEQALRGDKGE